MSNRSLSPFFILLEDVFSAMLRPKQEQLLQLLRDRKNKTPREIWDGVGVSKQGALDLLKPLVNVKKDR